MQRRNLLVISEFVLLGFSDSAEDQRLLTLLFFSMSLVNISGNMLIFLAISCDSKLHSPMYFFLSNLAFVDICYTSTTVPQMVVNTLTATKTISLSGCLMKLFFFISSVNMESFHLYVMVYDRYVAICHPLHYTNIMNPHLCVQLVAGLWVVMYLHALLHTVLMAHLSFCASNVVYHFFCDLNPLQQLSCCDVSFNVMIIYKVGAPLALTLLICTLISYVLIFFTILKVTSTQGKHRAFSTCGSLLLVIILFYGTAIAVYFSTSSSHTPVRDTLSYVTYNVLSPMLNPFIYSLRNRNMKRALLKILCKCTAFINNQVLSE